MTRLHIPQAWRETARAVLEERLRTILVLGAADRGKSTFCSYLIRVLVEAGHRVGYTDFTNVWDPLRGAPGGRTARCKSKPGARGKRRASRKEGVT
jgi:GTPase SAR1 family protein